MVDVTPQSIAPPEGVSDYYPLDKLMNWQGNFNQGDAGAIFNSIRKFGYNRSISVWQSPESESAALTVMAGNHTLMALKMLHKDWITAKKRGNSNLEKLLPKGNIVVKDDMWHILCNNCSHLSHNEAIAYAISDNRMSEIATQDNDMLLKYLMEIQESGDDDLIEAVGYDDGDIQFLLDAIGDEDESGHGEDNVPDEEQVDELMMKWQVAEGSLWIIPSKNSRGSHRLLCGDATSADDVKRLMGDELADAVLTDPPYGIDFDPSINRDNKGIASIPRPKIEGDKNTDTARDAYAIFCELTSVQIWWGGNYFTDFLPPSSCWLIWDKENTGDFADVEIAWCNLNKSARLFRHMWNGMLKASEKGEKRVHGTQKPVVLFEWCIDNFIDGSIIIDPFGGSGSSLIACENSKRQCRMMEISPSYCAVILERAENYGLKPYRYVDNK